MDDNQQFGLERILAIGEAKWSQAIASIVNQGVVPIDSIPDIAEYLAFQQVRTLQHRDDVRAMFDYFTTGLAVLELRARADANELDASETAAVDDFIKGVNDGKLRVQEPESNILAQQMKALPEIMKALQDGWHYIVVSLDHPGFVLTDHPITMLGDWDGTVSTGVGLATADEIWMPLDPLHAVVLTRDFTNPKHVFALSRTHVGKINERLVLESSRWTIYRPGTDPLKHMTIPKQPPRMFVDEFAVPGAGNPQSETLVEIGKERPHVEDERSLSGRRLRPFPHRIHKVLDDDPWVPDHDPAVDDLPSVDISQLPPGVAAGLRSVRSARSRPDEPVPDGIIRFPPAPTPAGTPPATAPDPGSCGLAARHPGRRRARGLRSGTHGRPTLGMRPSPRTG